MNSGFDIDVRTSDDFRFRDQIWQGLHKYPSGDEEWANKIETTNPLAVWIATLLKIARVGGLEFLEKLTVIGLT